MLVTRTPFLQKIYSMQTMKGNTAGENLRIVFATNGTLTPYAGMTNRAVSLANHIVNENKDTFFFTFLYKRDDIDPRIGVIEYTPFNVGHNLFCSISEKYSPSKYIFSKLISKQFQKINPHIVCVDHPPMDSYARAARKSADFKLIYTYHSDVDPALYSDRVRERLEKDRKHAYDVAKNADLVIAVSEFVKRQLDEIGIRSTVVYNGVDTDLFRPRLYTVSTYKTEIPTLLYVGRLLRFKGVDLLIKAFKQVKKEVADARLYIVGLTHDKANIEDWHEIEKLAKGFKDSIFFLGNVCDEVLSILYSVSDLYVCASLYEGFGMPFLEAQSCGVPCVGFDTSAIPEVVINGETGLLVEKGDVDELANSIIELLRDNESRRNMGAAARKHAKGFDWDIISNRFCREIEKL